MKKQSLKISLVASLLMIVCGVLASGPSAKADSENGSCSTQTLRGDYGFAIEGQVVAGPPAGQLLRGVAMTHFDGQGNLSQVDHVVVNGTLPPVKWRPASGAYTVNPDCTGTAQFTSEGSSSPNILYFVVVRLGREIRTVVEAPGIAATSIGIKIE
jgi:hypothetical protein